MPPDVEHQDIEVDDGGRIHVISRGEGQPLVLLHGVFLNSGIWVHQLADLSDDARIIAIDLRGHGRSVPGSDGFGLKVPDIATASRPLEDPVGDLLEATAGRMGPAGSNGTSGSGSAGTSGSTRTAGSDRTARARLVSTRRGEGRRVEGRRGEGRMLRPRRLAPPALERLALDVRQVLTALDIEGGLLVGHSMGGMVAMQAVAGLSAEERHRRLSGLVLTSTTTGPFVETSGMGPVRGVRARRQALRAIRASVRSGRGAIPKGDIRWWASRLGFGAEAPPAQVRFLEAMLGGRRASDDGGAARAVGEGEPHTAAAVGGHPNLGDGRNARPPHPAVARTPTGDPSSRSAPRGACALRSYADAREAQGVRPSPRGTRPQGELKGAKDDPCGPSSRSVTSRCRARSAR